MKLILTHNQLLNINECKLNFGGKKYEEVELYFPFTNKVFLKVLGECENENTIEISPEIVLNSEYCDGVGRLIDKDNFDEYISIEKDYGDILKDNSHQKRIIIF